MRPIYVIIIFLFVMTLLTLFVVKVYNSLVLLKNKIDADWQQIMLEIRYRADLTNKYLPLVTNIVSNETIENTRMVLDKLSRQMSWEDIMNSYIELERFIERIKIEVEDKNIHYAEWEKAFVENKMRLDKARDIYNDDILGMNNKVDLFPFSIIAGICGYEKYIYFRSES
ncbi:MAG: LemA family protein [Bacilli bacterium]|nr:LemA family protein [Bacilli bacterium]